MPISVFVSLVGAAIACFVYIVGDFGRPNSTNLILVATTAFTIVATLGLFWIFFQHRDDPPTKFGRVAREHISTIVVSLMISLIFTGISLAEAFGVSANEGLIQIQSADK